MLISSISHELFPGSIPLPNELLTHCFTFIDKKNLQTCTRVSKPWLGFVLLIASRAEILEVNNFIRQIISQLDSERRFVHIHNLECLKLNPKNKFANLKSIKKIKLSFKNQLIPILLSFNEDEEEKIKKIPTPLFLQNIYNLNRLYKEISRLDELTDNAIKDYFLNEKSNAFAQEGEFIIAIKLAKQITDESNRKSAVSYALAQKNRTAQALGLTQTISEIDRQKTSYRSIALILAKRGDLSSAFEVVNQIPTKAAQDSALLFICKNLVNMDKLTEALSLVNEINSKGTKLSAFKKIFYQLAITIDTKEVLEIANEIIWLPHRIGITSLIFALKKDYKTSVENLNKIIDPSTFAYVSCCLIKIFSENGEFSLAIGIANNIIDDSTRRWAYETIEAWKNKLGS